MKSLSELRRCCADTVVRIYSDPIATGEDMELANRLMTLCHFIDDMIG